MDRKRRKLKAFTLVELVVVVAIISVLMMIIVPNVLDFIRSNRINEANGEAQQVYMAAQEYLTDKQINGAKPDDLRNDPTTSFCTMAVSVPKPGAAYTYISSSSTTMKSESVGKAMADGIIKRLGADFEGSFMIGFYPQTFTMCYATFNSYGKTDSIRSTAATTIGKPDGSNFYTRIYGNATASGSQEYDARRALPTAYTGQYPVPIVK